MKRSPRKHLFGLTAVIALAYPAGALALQEAWTVYEDSLTTTSCGVVNAWNAELLVVHDTGTMVVVSGQDVVMEDLYVSAAGEVFYLDDPVGFLEFGEDGDGLPTLFWTTLTGTLVEIDTFTGEPFDSEFFPEDRLDTYCDGCDLVDSSPYCGDGTDDTDDIVDVLVPLLCGAGGTTSLALTATLLPLVGWSARRRRPRR